MVAFLELGFGLVLGVLVTGVAAGVVCPGEARCDAVPNKPCRPLVTYTGFYGDRCLDNLGIV